MKDKKTIYFAGELFSAKHIVGNALLAEEIESISDYFIQLPQNYEKRHADPKSIRDEDLKMVHKADALIVNYDGLELDSGTVVEYMFAKFADIPTVILRSDFRGSGKADGKKLFPWNLMTSFFPRTEVIILNSFTFYQKTFLSKKSNKTAALELIEHTAKEVKGALDRVIATKPTMPDRLKKPVDEWLEILPDYDAS